MPKDSAPPVDRRALKVLFNTYWTSAGWRDEQTRFTSPDDFEYAKRVGAMFDDIRLSHADIVSRATGAVRDLDRRVVADANVRTVLYAASTTTAMLQRLMIELPPSRPFIKSFLTLLNG
jgi:hypothetical protein